MPDLERYYESSVPDSIAAAIWFTGTTPVVLLVSIPIIILMINHLVLCH